MDGFIYGLDELYFKGVKIGYISEEGLKPAGDQPSTTKIRAAQARNQVVKILETTPGTLQFTFTLIELKKENLAAVFGGSVSGGTYSAPRTAPDLEGPMFIKCFSKHKMSAPKVKLTSNLAGSVNLSELLSIACTAEVELPDDPDKGPFDIYDPGETVPGDPSVTEG
jgi:hypothetical protein